MLDVFSARCSLVGLHLIWGNRGKINFLICHAVDRKPCKRQDKNINKSYFAWQFRRTTGCDVLLEKTLFPTPLKLSRITSFKHSLKMLVWSWCLVNISVIQPFFCIFSQVRLSYWKFHCRSNTVLMTCFACLSPNARFFVRSVEVWP